MNSLIAILLTAASLGADPTQQPVKKIIEWGWDEPNTGFMRENIQQMEQFPFDGLVFHIDSSRGGNFAWEIWSGRRFELVEFQHAIDDLKSTPFRRLTDRFLRVNVTPGNVDWFDDDAWAVVQSNFGVAARVTRQSGSTGFMFDVEQYNASLFDYRKQPQGEGRSFADYQTMVRRRGRQWMEEVGRCFPEITILLTFGYRIAQPPKSGDRSTAAYGLYADFLDGMLETCPEKTKLVDAWEYSYPYKTDDQFHRAYDSIQSESLKWTSAAQQYRKHVSAGFGIWMDCSWRQVGWNLDDFSKNHFTPQEFEKSVRAALKATDHYVWIYTEQPRWWPREKLPEQYVEALSKARQPADAQ